MPIRSSYVMIAEDDPAFSAWWNKYPRRVSKKDARRAWAELNPSPQTIEKMMTALDWQILQPQWAKDDGQFIPYPAGYLRSERFDDEPPAHLRPKAERPECPHVERCLSRWRCDQYLALDPQGLKYPIKRAA
jgi:hypothetical protein